jgi:hypothetical protein
MVENIKLQMLKNVHKMQGNDSNANFEPSNRSEVQEKKHLLKWANKLTDGNIVLSH